MPYELILIDERKDKELFRLVSNDPRKFKNRLKVVIKEVKSNSEIRSFSVNNPRDLQARINAAIDLKFSPVSVKWQEGLN